MVWRITTSLTNSWHVLLACLTIGSSAVAVATAQTVQTIAITAVTNSADFQPGLPQKGSLASIFTTGLEGTQGVYTQTQYPLSNMLNGVSVWINFLPAPILSVAFLTGYQQINVQVPWEGQRDPLYVEVFQNGIRAHTEDTQAKGFSVFFADQNGYAIVQHAMTYSLVTPQNPAHPGEYLVAYGLNLGPVNHAPPSGAPSPSNPPAVSVPPGTPEEGTCLMFDVITLGSATSSPSYVGLVPGSIGVYQVNFQVPAATAVGDLALTLVRTLLINPLEPCHGSGLGDRPVVETSRPVILPVR
jgi:uncharacterized protein (TIGR03437 family)